MPIPELIGSAEAADLLEIGPTNFSHLRAKQRILVDSRFPEPVVDLRCGPIWAKKDMVAYKKHYDSTRRRVRSSNGDTAVVETPAKAKATKAPAKPRKAPAKKTPAKKTAAKKKLALVGS